MIMPRIALERRNSRALQAQRNDIFLRWARMTKQLFMCRGRAVRIELALAAGFDVCELPTMIFAFVSSFDMFLQCRHVLILCICVLF